MKALKIIVNIFAVILIVAIVGGTFAAVTFGVYNIQKAKKAIIILPGLFASGLYDTATGKGVWDPLENLDINFGDVMGQEGVNLETVVSLLFEDDFQQEILKLFQNEGMGAADSLFNLMAVNEDGSPKVGTVKAVPWDSQSRLKYGVINAQKAMYDYMEGLYGEDYEVQCFNYDFRVDNRVSAQLLQDYIDSKGYQEIILVSHSNGGQVASIYLAQSEANRNKVKKYISYNSPYYGSFSAINILENVDGMMSLLNSFLPVSNDNIQNVFDYQFSKLLNVWTAYQLLPSYELISAPYNGEQAGLYLDGQRMTFNNQVDLWDFYCSRPWAKMSNGELRPAMAQWLDYKESITVALPDGQRVLSTTLVDTVYFTGNGVPSLYKSYYRTDGDQISYINSQSHLMGDGTVSYSSSVAMLDDETRIIVCQDRDHYGVVNDYNNTASQQTKEIIDAYIAGNTKWYEKLWNKLIN